MRIRHLVVPSTFALTAALLGTAPAALAAAPTPIAAQEDGIDLEEVERRRFAWKRGQSTE